MPGQDDNLELTSPLTVRLVDNARDKVGGGRQTAHLPDGRLVSLLVTAGPQKGKSFPLQKAQVMIGRNQGDIPIDDAKVSRSHCVLEVHGTTAIVVDLDSANGTHVNGKKIASCELDHLSEFRVGDTTLLFAVTGGRQ
jgi:hypothetical protein